MGFHIDKDEMARYCYQFPKETKRFIEYVQLFTFQVIQSISSSNFKTKSHIDFQNNQTFLWFVGRMNVTIEIDVYKIFITSGAFIIMGNRC